VGVSSRAGWRLFGTDARGAKVAPVLAATVPPLALGRAPFAAAVALGPSVPVGAALLLGAYPAALCLTGTVTRRPGALARVTGAPLLPRVPQTAVVIRPTTADNIVSLLPRCWRRPTATWWWWTTTRPTGGAGGRRLPPPTRSSTS